MVLISGSDQLRRIITLENLKVIPFKMSLSKSHVKLPVMNHPVMNGLDNAVIMEVLSWKIKFSVDGRLMSRKSSRKFHF